MKKIIISISLFFLSVVAFSQIAQPGSYTPDTTMGKFAGTWRWVSGNDTVVMVLQKQKLIHPAPYNFYSDNLIGWHTYIKNGKLKESSMSHMNTPEDTFATIHIGISYGTKLRGAFHDLTNHKWGDMFFNLQANSTTKATLTLQDSEGVRVHFPGQPAFIGGFTLPSGIVLKKIK